jgi:hypothetical protein
MSDEFEVKITYFAKAVADLYGRLVIACATLPVTPIELPTGDDGHPVNLGGREVTDAVRRVMEIGEEMPLPEQHWAELFAACAYWCGAVDLLSLQIAQPEVDRGPSVTGNLTACESSLADLMDWLAEQ